METKLTRLLDIKYPIIQGAMAWVSDHHIASAVSKAGGLGIIAAGNAPVEVVKEEIRLLKEKTSKPFGVNIMLMSPTAPEIAKLVIDEKVPVVTTGAGSPGQYMETWKAAGIKVIPVVASVSQAVRSQRTGADAVIAEGCEAGGHIGELTTMALTPQVVKAVTIPVITAGGVGDGNGMAAALMLGADGVQSGTVFLTAKECNIHENYKNEIINAKDTSTAVVGRFTGHPVRQLKNRLSREMLKMEKDNSNPDNFEELAVGSLKKATVDGNITEGAFMAGQIAGILEEIKTTEEILKQMTDQAEDIITNFEKRSGISFG